MSLLSRLNRRLDKAVDRQIAAAQARHPSNVRLLPNRLRCFVCGADLASGDGALCRACALDSA